MNVQTYKELKLTWSNKVTEL